jgi:membrane-associated phospholipid phosphatase
LKNTRFILLALFLFFAVRATWTAFRLDTPLRTEILKTQGKGWKKSDQQRFHSGVRRYGDWPWLMLGSGVCLLAAWRLRNREWQRILIAAMLASTLAGILANASRLTTGRTRPRESPKIEQGFYGPWKDGRLTIGDQAYNSFPSGHTATAFGLAWVLLLARPWLGMGGLVLAALVGWSSIVMGTHHLSDVVVSIFLSFAVAWFTWKWVRKNGDQVAHHLREKFRKIRKKPSGRIGDQG